MQILRPLLLLVLVTSAGLCAAPAQAQVSRLYFAGYMGLNVYRDLEFRESSQSIRGEIKPQNSHNFAGAMGLRLSQTLRLEAELNYNKANFDNISLSDGTSAEVGGETTNWLLMANAYYDFDVPWKVQPFLTAGVGYAMIDADIQDLSGLAANATDQAGVLAWQFGGGMKYRLSPVMAVTGMYRYIDSMNAQIGTYDINYNNHEFRVGFESDLPFE